MFSGNVQSYLELLEEYMLNPYDRIINGRLNIIWGKLNESEKDLVFRHLRECN